MNTIINQLLDVDREARMILDEARQYYDNTIDEIAAEKKHMLERYEEKAAEHLNNVCHSESSGVSDEISALGRQYSGLTAAIDAVFAQNRGCWEDELFRRCVGR